MFEGVAAATASGTKSEIIKDTFGEGYFQIEETKISVSKKGTYAIVELSPIHLFGEDNNFRADQLYCVMQKEGEHDTMFDQFVAQYVAAFYGVQPGHQYHEGKDANNAEWAKMCFHTFGEKTLNVEKQEFEFKGTNPFAGAVIHLKSIRDFQGHKKEADKAKNPDGTVRVFTKVLVLGAVDPADVPIEAIQKNASTLMPAYTARLEA